MGSFFVLLLLNMSRYADIVLPVPLNQYFTYSVPPELELIIAPGKRVYVPFGKGRKLTGIVMKLHNIPPVGVQTKDIISVTDMDGTTLLPYQLELMEWISTYYLCAPGDVMKALLPGTLRPESKNEQKAYKPKTEPFVKLHHSISPESIDETISGLKRAKKQQEVLKKYLEISEFNAADGSFKAISKRYLQGKVESVSALQALIQNNILEQYDVETERLISYTGSIVEANTLTESQERAFAEIKESFKKHNISLLYGVTSSGKTEIYIKLIQEQIKMGRQVLYLLPEIALTTQIMHRLQQIFGNEMAIYHSNCSDIIRAEIWQKQLGNRPFSLILGTRSAIMLPFRNLGLVIVDEEHETSYKQEDPAPRYNARNVSIMMGIKCGAKILLGSATPSFESYANALWEKYGLVTLEERYTKVGLPDVTIVDIAEMRRKKYMKGAFSPQLINAVNEAIERDEQVILFHNRRGYSSVVECDDCGWVQKCTHCDVSLTYHKNVNMAVCHYCGKRYPIVKNCPECGSNTLNQRGYGTERIAEHLQELVPEARIAIMDSDIQRSRYQEIIQNFQDGKTNVLIGTQMISKGFDFDNVSTVGILQADALMNFPDFRALEHTYQLISQVVGRAGRRNIRGKVILQTRQPDNQLIQMLSRHNYRAFFNEQMNDRLAFVYPPYSRLTILTLKGRSAKDVEQIAYRLCQLLSGLFGEERVLGPDAPMISRIQNQHIRNIVLKVDHKTSYLKSRQIIDCAIQQVKELLVQSGVTYYFDVDPL